MKQTNDRQHDLDWSGQRVLITGALGTVGSERIGQFLEEPVEEVVGLDNDESDLFRLNERHNGEEPLRLYLCDIRDEGALRRKMDGIDVVLHAAAYKHVILCEKAPRDAVQTNILGTQSVIDAALATGVDRVLLTSTDKAVNPTSVMGTSKLMGERLMTSANALRRADTPVFASTRFGNVLGSSGSVIPIFRRQIAEGGPVTLTDPGMTRFIMTLEEAVRLVLESVSLARGGEVFVTKMPAIRIEELAEVMVEELAPAHGHDPGDVEIEVIGAKPGEKMYEELINEEETRRTVELERYFAVVPAFKSPLKSVEYEYPNVRQRGVGKAYNSANVEPLGRGELRDYLLENRLIEPAGESRESPGRVAAPY